MTYGVFPEGLVVPNLDDIRTDLETDILGDVDPGLDLSDESPMGQLVTILAEREEKLWALGETAYNAFNRGAAEGKLLENIGGLTGTPRQGPTRSKVPAALTLNAGVTVVAGKKVRVPGTTALWSLLYAVTNSGGAPAAIPGIFQADEDGPTVANANTLTEIVTPVTGWLGVNNATDAEMGALIESETAYRARQVSEAAKGGSCTLPAIYADVIAVPNVIACKPFENTSLVTDADGLPGKSFEVVVWDGTVPDADDDAILAAIFKNKPGGIKAFGGTDPVLEVVGSIVDEAGISHDIRFRRADGREVYFDIDITTGPDFDLVSGPPAVKAAMVAAGAALDMGDDVVALVFRAAALTVPGVTDAPGLRLDLTGALISTANIAIGSREIALFDTVRIDVNIL